MTGDPIILPPAGKSCMALNAALIQAASGTPVPLPQQEVTHSHVHIESMVGTCDPELERRYRGGMAMTTGDPSTDTSTWCTISLPPDYRSKRLDRLVLTDRSMPTNQGMKNLPRDRKHKRRAKNKQARASRKHR